MTEPRATKVLRKRPILLGYVAAIVLVEFVFTIMRFVFTIMRALGWIH